MILRIAPFTDLSPDMLYSVLRLRCDVFVVEQHCAYPEVDGRDLEPGTRHFWLISPDPPDDAGTATDAGTAVAAYLRVLAEPGGAARVGRVCTAPSFRGRGLARRLMVAALEWIGPQRVCVLDAQAHLVDFYGAFGFRVTGATYLDDGIPHVPMTRPATP